MMPFSRPSNYFISKLQQVLPDWYIHQSALWYLLRLILKDKSPKLLLRLECWMIYRMDGIAFEKQYLLLQIISLVDTKSPPFKALTWERQSLICQERPCLSFKFVVFRPSLDASGCPGYTIPDLRSWVLLPSDYAWLRISFRISYQHRYVQSFNLKKWILILLSPLSR